MQTIKHEPIIQAAYDAKETRVIKNNFIKGTTEGIVNYAGHKLGEMFEQTEYDCQRATRSMYDICGKNSYLTDVKYIKDIKESFSELHVNEGFRDQIVANFNQGGACYNAIAFYRVLFQNFFEDPFFLDTFERSLYKFEKKDDDRVKFTSVLDLNKVTLRHASGDNPGEEIDLVGPFFSVKTSFDFVWNPETQQMSIDDVQSIITPKDELEDFLEEVAESDLYANKEDLKKKVTESFQELITPILSGDLSKNDELEKTLENLRNRLLGLEIFTSHEKVKSRGTEEHDCILNAFVDFTAFKATEHRIVGTVNAVCDYASRIVSDVLSNQSQEKLDYENSWKIIQIVKDIINWLKELLGISTLSKESRTLIEGGIDGLKRAFPDIKDIIPSVKEIEEACFKSRAQGDKSKESAIVSDDEKVEFHGSAKIRRSQSSPEIGCLGGSLMSSVSEDSFKSLSGDLSDIPFADEDVEDKEVKHGVVETNVAKPDQANAQRGRRASASSGRG